MCVKLRKDGDQQHHISNKLRELARLVLETRKCCDSVSTFTDCLLSKNFDFVVEAVTELSGWDEDEGTLARPSIGIKLGHSLRKCSKILKGDGIKKGSKSLVNQADNFATLVDLNWNDKIARIARRELDQRKWNKPHLLPLTSDLQLLQKHLKMVIADSINGLASNNNDVKVYRNLSTAILATLILFNRRRGGEPALLTINDFEKRAMSVINEEVKKSLSPFELRLCKSFTKIDIRGKRGRKVPLLLTKEMENGIKLLIKLRDDVGVKAENKYVFAVLGNGSLKNIRGPDAIRKHVKLCQLKCPEAIYSTNLRKHVATLSQLLNLQQNEQEMLATFMGHDIAIHREYYRLPEDTLQLAKCSKILLLMEKGEIGNYSGKSLSEIEINLEGKSKRLIFLSIF